MPPPKNPNLPLLPVHPEFAAKEINADCTLTSRAKVLACIIPAISARYNQTVTEKTKLGAGGLGLDSVMIQTDLYATVVIAVHQAKCQLRTFGQNEIGQCKTVGDIADGIWKDLIA